MREPYFYVRKKGTSFTIYYKPLEADAHQGTPNTSVTISVDPSKLDFQFNFVFLRCDNFKLRENLQE